MNNTAVKGLIYIDSFHRTVPLLIDDNKFMYNGAYFGASAIFIRARAVVGRNLKNIVSNLESSL